MFKYPEINSFKEEMLPVSDIHTLYIAQYGNPNGKPVLFVHGGPGGGCAPDYARFFNPEKYWVILVDQRGCGKSTPHACLDDNETDFLIEDFEKIRKHLNIDKWQLFGGSWGSTLSLAYAQKYPEVVSEMILRGIFLTRSQEVDWLFQNKPGAKTVFPDYWEKYAALVPDNERHDMLGYYYKMLTSDDEQTKLKAAKAFVNWELSISKLLYDPKAAELAADPHFCLPFARLEAHYLSQHAFLKPNQLLNEADKIKHIPGVIVQGRYDMVCPVQSAWDLHKVWDAAELIIVPDAGHSTLEASIIKALTNAAEKFAG